MHWFCFWVSQSFWLPMHMTQALQRKKGNRAQISIALLAVCVCVCVCVTLKFLYFFEAKMWAPFIATRSTRTLNATQSALWAKVISKRPPSYWIRLSNSSQKSLATISRLESRPRHRQGIHNIYPPAAGNIPHVVPGLGWELRLHMHDTQLFKVHLKSKSFARAIKTLKVAINVDPKYVNVREAHAIACRNKRLLMWWGRPMLFVLEYLSPGCRVQGYVQLAKLETKMGYCQDAVDHLSAALG